MAAHTREGENRRGILQALRIFFRFGFGQGKLFPRMLGRALAMTRAIWSNHRLLEDLLRLAFSSSEVSRFSNSGSPCRDLRSESLRTCLLSDTLCRTPDANIEARDLGRRLLERERSKETHRQAQPEVVLTSQRESPPRVERVTSFLRVVLFSSADLTVKSGRRFWRPSPPQHVSISYSATCLLSSLPSAR